MHRPVRKVTTAWMCSGRAHFRTLRAQNVDVEQNNVQVEHKIVEKRAEFQHKNEQFCHLEFEQKGSSNSRLQQTSYTKLVTELKETSNSVT